LRREKNSSTRSHPRWPACALARSGLSGLLGGAGNKEVKEVLGLHLGAYMYPVDDAQVCGAATVRQESTLFPSANPCQSLPSRKLAPLFLAVRPSFQVPSSTRHFARLLPSFPSRPSSILVSRSPLPPSTRFCLFISHETFTTGQNSHCKTYSDKLYKTRPPQFLWLFYHTLKFHTHRDARATVHSPPSHPRTHPSSTIFISLHRKSKRPRPTNKKNSTDFLSKEDSNDQEQ